MEIPNLIEEVSGAALDRRRFFKRAGAAGLAVATTTMLGGAVEKAAAASTLTDIDIGNFALNLEYLEAEFYSVATYGATLEQRGLIPSSAVSGPTMGGKMISFSGSPEAFLASMLRFDEESHVVFLRKALGSAAIKKPTLNLNAMGFGFGNVNEFIKLGSMLEDVGLSAYVGAAPMLKSPSMIDAAARITGTEGQHLGALRTTAIRLGITVPKVDAVDVPPTQSKPLFVDNKGLTIPRSMSQVLKIAYAGGSHSGGFFPDGFNGAVK